MPNPNQLFYNNMPKNAVWSEGWKIGLKDKRKIRTWGIRDLYFAIFVSVKVTPVHDIHLTLKINFFSIFTHK